MVTTPLSRYRRSDIIRYRRIVHLAGIFEKHRLSNYRWQPISHPQGRALCRHKECDGISNHRRLHRFLKHLLKCKSKKTSKLHVTGLCKGNPPLTGRFSTQKASNAKNVSIWWSHHWYQYFKICTSFERYSDSSCMRMRRPSAIFIASYYRLNLTMSSGTSQLHKV